MLSLLAGKPNPSAFPFTSLQFTAKAPPSDPHSKAILPSDGGISSPEITISLTSSALAEGLQYGPTAGIPSLVEWVTELQKKVHGRRNEKVEGGDGGWRVSIGSGSQDLLYKVSGHTFLCLL